MYFDFDYYFRLLRHVWNLKHWPGRWRLLARLLLVTPPVTLFHTLCFLLDYLLFPSLWRQPVRTPVFIVGHARSGTTLMHRLMSADGDRFSYFLYWETLFPSLLQKKVIRWLGRVDQALLGGMFFRRLKAWDDRTFGPFRHIHNMSLWNSEEDQFAMRAAFVTQQWATDLPVMDVLDLFHLDQMPKKRRRWMHHYRELVKRQLLLNGGDRIHLSKNPVMSGWVGSIIETFPDARIVVMLRDPAQCVPSLLKLVEKSWKARGWKPADYQASLDLLLQTSFESFHNPAQQLARYPEVPRAIVDYRELTARPRETVHEVYRQLGFDVGSEFDAFLQANAEREKKHHSKFEYSLGDYRITADQLEAELGEFYRQYAWPRAGATQGDQAAAGAERHSQQGEKHRVTT
ncbi:MAG: sulfotransferase family protein [Haliea sp.]|nr:sulfotransferase family protein [Haliea sp.]|tara:strand:+ start:66554 stop:67759 length:1206 start_codon:yes stop_codon:yes gene_type:complete